MSLAVGERQAAPPSRDVRRGRAAGLDILRAFAALVIVVGHSYRFMSGHVISLTDRSPIHLLITQSATGVWLFFVLSGYLVAKPFVQGILDGSGVEGRGYAYKRIARIYPAFWLSLLAVLLVVGVGNVDGGKRAILANVLLLHNLLPGSQRGIVHASWTLTIEVCFYLFLPIATWVILRISKRRITPRQLALGVVVLWVLSAAWGAGFSALPQDKVGIWLREVFPAMVGCFCPGVLLAIAEHDDLVGPRWRGRIERCLSSVWFMVPAVVIFGALGSYGGTLVYNLPLYTLSSQMWIIAYGILLAYFLRRPITSRGVVVRVLTWLGVLSYGVYLWQSVIVQALQHYGAGVPLTARWVGSGADRLPVQSHPGFVSDLVQLLYLVALAIAAAAISWYLIEARLISWSRRKARAVRQPDDRPTDVLAST